MDRLYLLRLGELTLKGENRDRFEFKLKKDLKRRLEGVPNRIDMRDGRFFLWVVPDKAREAEYALAHLPGIAGFARALSVDKDMPSILAAARELSAEGPIASGKKSFKVEARRTDKSFALNSHQIACELGSGILDAFPGTHVDVHKPEFFLSVEIRDRAYVYVDDVKAVRGLPIGSSGKGLLLLSGGIDSPVAGYLMGLRGLILEAVHFHAYPFTSKEAQEKVEELASLIARWVGPISLHVVPFTAAQVRIKERARENETTLLMRAAMMEVADKIAKARGANCLITGESLGQVASQTMESMRFTGSTTDLPVFRPLIGHDKLYTMDLARSIGTYSVSIKPFEDCCVIFSPKHPLLKPDLAAEAEAYARLEIGQLLDEAIAQAEIKLIDPAPADQGESEASAR
jgi:tRNA uracil 4-sulfurtransferase